MKKFLLSLITLVYLMMSSGIAMETHYCMGKQSGVDFYKTSESKCSRCGMKERKGGCCHDEHRLYKMSNEHKNAVAFQLNYFSQVPAATPIFSYTQFLAAMPLIPALLKSPPGIPRPDICISNCIFRI